jgi:hypothetical protein
VRLNSAGADVRSEGLQPLIENSEHLPVNHHGTMRPA